MGRSHEQRFRSRKEVQAHRRNQQENGFIFKLSATCAGMPEDEWDEVRVRRISLNDSAALNMIPEHMQDQVNRGLQLIEEVNKKVQAEGKSTNTLRERLSGNDEVLAAADGFCIATFIAPKLYESESALNASGDDTGWVVTDIHPDDRIDILFANLDSDSAAAKKFRTYTQRPGTDARSGNAGPVAAQSLDDPGPVIRSL